MVWAQTAMAKNKSRTISEVFTSVAPKGYGPSQGIPAAPTIAAGVSSDGDLAGALSSAGESIKQLQGAYESQAALIQANTAALGSNTDSKSAGSAAASAVSSVFGGGGLLGLLGPVGLVVEGISGLFGGSSAALPVPYVAPPPVSISGAVSGAPAEASPAASSSSATTVNVTVTAMDSQSFMDHSHEIASAVRSTMLDNHPINNVISTL
jgi:hypothetical protein